MLCSSAIALMFRVSESRNMDRYIITTTNYMVAASVSLVFLYLEGVLDHIGAGIPGLFARELSTAISGNGFSTQASVGWAAAVGIPAGALYFLGFIYLQKGVRESGVSLTASFSKLGVIVPMILSIILWRELPLPIQWAGIVLALASIVLAAPKRGDHADISNFSPVLLALFVIVGLADFTNKIYQRYGVLEVKSLYLFFVFFMALAVSLWRTASLRRRPSMRDCLAGVAVGIPNFFTSYFLILALSRLRTAVVFPVYGAATIVVVSLFGAVVFRERLSRRERIAVATTIIALVLVNLR